MKVIQSAPVRAQIQAFKRFLEKPVVFNHSAQLNNQFYYKVQYWRFGKVQAVGYLIMRPDGQLVPREEAIPVMRLFQLHNIAAHRFLRNFAIDKEKPVWMFEQMQECLQGVFPAYADERNETIREDVQKLLEVCTHMIQSREKLRRIYDRGVEGHNQMRARGYVIPADETHLYDCLYESDYILYERLRIQELIWSSLDRLSAFFSHGNPKLSKEMEKKRKKLVDLLNDYKKKKLKVITDKSVSSFEIGITGQRTVFQSAEHLKEIYQIENELVFKKDCVPLLRNP